MTATHVVNVTFENMIFTTDLLVEVSETDFAG